MDHIDSEYYEVSRVSDPDALSIDSIHKTVFRYCINVRCSLHDIVTNKVWT